MENTNITAKEPVEVKSTYEQAVELHCKVMVSREMAFNALAEFAKNLKAMRDGKLYLELGHESFDDYIENEVHVGKRQVYKYISIYESLGSTVLQSTAQLGIEKLALLTEVADVERPDFIEDNDLQGMSVKELKALIEKSKKQEEQLSLLSVKIEDVEAEYDNTIKELEELKSRPIDVAVEEPSKADIDKIRQQIEDEVKDKFETEKKQAIKDAKEKADIKAKKDFDKQIEQAKVEAATKATEEMKTTLSGLQEEQAKMLEKTKQMEKELSVKGDADIVKVMCLFDNLQNYHAQIISGLKAVAEKDQEKARKLATGISSFFEKNAIPALKEV